MLRIGVLGMTTGSVRGFPGGSDDKASACNVRPGFDPWVGKIPWRRKWQPTPVLLTGKFHGWSRRRLQSMGLQRMGHN